MSDQMSRENWEKIHKMHNTDVIGMIMDHKHKRVTSEQLFEIISSYCEMAYRIGKKEEMKNE